MAMYKRQNFFTVIELILVILLILGIIGWVKNIVKLSDCDFEAPYKCEIIHVVGIFPPAGAITGWLTVDK